MSPVTPEVADRVGMSFRRLDYAVRRGLIPGPPSAGTGYPRHWTTLEVATADRYARLVSAGFAPEAAGRVAQAGPGRHEIAPGLFVEIDVPAPAARLYAEAAIAPEGAPA